MHLEGKGQRALFHPAKVTLMQAENKRCSFLRGSLSAEPGVQQCLLKQQVPNEIQDENTCISSSESPPWEIEEPDARQVGCFLLIKLKRHRS